MRESKHFAAAWLSPAFPLLETFLPSDPYRATQPLLVTQTRKEPPVLVTQPALLLFMLRTTPFHFIQVSINVFPQGSHLLPYLPFPVTKTFFTSRSPLSCRNCFLSFSRATMDTQNRLLYPHQVRRPLLKRIPHFHDPHLLSEGIKSLENDLRV